MSDHGKRSPDQDLVSLMEENSHVSAAIEAHYEESKEYPIVVDMENLDDYESRYPNVLYQVDEAVFVHIYADRGVEISYNVIEPVISDREERLLEEIKDRMLIESGSVEVPQEKSEIEDYVQSLLSRIMIDENSSIRERIKAAIGDRVQVNDMQRAKIEYRLKRDVANLGPLTTVLSDIHNEDIHVIGSNSMFVDHGVYGLVETDVTFGPKEEYDQYLRNLGERINNPVSDSDPIIDSTLPDGSRINIIYSDDISVKGPAITIRQGEEVPLSILQITKWGTLSPMMAAYLWLCLENDRTVFVVGETASGKTTTLNAITTFIPNDSKIYTAEDTTEVTPPQDAWQQNMTRESPDKSSTDIDMFRLVEASLRSRPDYIIVGEVRGEEAQMAFQAAQTGHPVLLTFHASDIKSMIQRFTGNPINVPETFMDNCDVALFQNRVKGADGQMLRRVTSVSEITGYSDEQEGVISKEVFSWDSANDEHQFKGMNNSYILEEKVAELLGYEDKTNIYDVLKRREKIINRMIEQDIMHFEDVNDAIDLIQNDGVEALDFDTTGLSK